MTLTIEQRAERARLAHQLTDLAGAPVPAALTVALYDLQRRGHELHLAADDHELDQAANIIRAADRHALIVLPRTARRRLLRTRVHLEPLHRPAQLPHRLARLATGPNGNSIRHKRTAGTGTATFITIGSLVLINIRGDFRRIVSRTTREGIQRRRNNDHAPRAQLLDQAPRTSSAHAPV